MRDIWQVTDLPTHGGQVQLASNPQKLTIGAIKNIVYRAIRSQQIIKNLIKKGDSNRLELKMMHGFRKAFKTICENSGMKSINIEILIGHNIGVSSSYYKPKQQEVMLDYFKVVDDLTINEENKLSKEIQELQEKSLEKDYIMTGKLVEKNEQINQLMAKQEKFEHLIHSLIESGQLKPQPPN